MKDNQPRLWIFKVFILGFIFFAHEIVLADDNSWRRMSLREKIGQTVILMYGDSEFDKALSAENNGAEFFKKYPISGVFLASWNIKVKEKNERLLAYRKIINDFNRKSAHPLFFLEDFEQGIDFAGGGEKLPSLMAFGAANSPKLAWEAGQMTAYGAKEIGLNWILNPVADLAINPLNPLISTRAVSDNPEKVINIIGPMIQAMTAGGLISTAKHFPGDGVDFRNQHIMTSVNSLSKAQWNSSFGKVYRRLIENGVPSIMVGHIALPAFQTPIENNVYLPASLSSELINGLLRKQLHFEGVTISDALNMGGIHGYFNSEVDTQIAAFKAGIDVLLWPSLEYFDKLEAAIKADPNLMSRLDEAVARIWAMKKRFGLLAKAAPVKTVIPPPNSNLAKQIAERSITLVKNDLKTLPLNSGKHPKLLIVLTSGENNPEQMMQNFETSKMELVRRGFEVTMQFNLPYYEVNLQKIESSYDNIIFIFDEMPNLAKLNINPNSSSSTLTYWSANNLVRRNSSNVICISFGDPSTQNLYVPLVHTSINAYSDHPESQKAVIKVLTGEIQAMGTSPVEGLVPTAVRSSR